jgi:hypothetical protein
MFKELIPALGEGFQYHRKLWEWVIVTQALKERGCLSGGKRGLGFAVGQEQLPAFFAKNGCIITATDLDTNDERSKKWQETNQLAKTQFLNKKGICPEDTFKKNVTYRPVDMNIIPDDLKEFDFTWSDCSFEHLGSIQNGLDFILNQMKTLKTGGWAVHTTELNLSSNNQTLDSGSTVLFRKKDIEWLINELEKQGNYVSPMNWELDNTEIDTNVDIPPYTGKYHLKLNLAGFVSTSIMIIIQKTI